jgi:hypothetical protein
VTATWQVGVYQEKFTEPVSALSWSEDDAAGFLRDVAADNGPGTLVELIDPDGTVVASEAVLL